MLRLFERGNREEDWIAEELRKIGVDLITRDPQTGQQFRVLFLGGHFGGSADGKGLNFPEAAKTWHLFECKTSNDKGFAELESKGVKVAKPEHYAQVQVYMHGLGLTRAFYFCVNKNDDRIYTERIHYDADAAEVLLAKASTIIFAPEPLTKISEDPSWWKCKFCFARPICHLDDVAKLERNCRTCASSTPNENGTWFCEVHKKKLSVEDQRIGCDRHLFIPKLLPWQPIEYREAEHAVVYATGKDMVMVDRERMLTPMKFDAASGTLTPTEVSAPDLLFPDADAPVDH